MSLFAHPGETLEASAVFETGLVGTLGFQIIDTPSGDVATARTTLGIVERPADSGLYYIATTAPATLGSYSIVWDDTEQYAQEDLVVAYQHPAAPPAEAAGPTFATVEDVASRLGRALTEAEEDQVEFLLLTATAVILEAVDKDEAWLLAGVGIPALLRYVCADMVARALTFVPGVQSTTESLGEYSYSQRASSSEYGGLWLGPLERLVLRSAVWGSLAGSARTASIAFDPEPWT